MVHDANNINQKTRIKKFYKKRRWCTLGAPPYVVVSKDYLLFFLPFPFFPFPDLSSFEGLTDMPWIVAFFWAAWTA